MHLPHAAIQKAETPVRPERLEGKSGADKALWRRVCRPAARFVSSDRTPSSVIPAKAGIQNRWLRARCPWIPAFAGMTRASRSCLSAATDSIPPLDGEGRRRQRRRRGGVRHCGTASPLARESPPPQRDAGPPHEGEVCSKRHGCVRPSRAGRFSQPKAKLRHTGESRYPEPLAPCALPLDPGVRRDDENGRVIPQQSPLSKPRVSSVHLVLLRGVLMRRHDSGTGCGARGPRRNEAPGRQRSSLRDH